MANPIQGAAARPVFKFMNEEIPRPTSGDGPSFGDLFKQAMNEASGLQEESQRMIAAFVRGEPVELHQVMAAAQEASLSVELLVEIRNKLTEAYRSVMNMQ
jgi:flagellar hook-basal body complex protein FliE